MVECWNVDLIQSDRQAFLMAPALRVKGLGICLLVRTRARGVQMFV